ncbi:MAG: hypothetical protein R3E74_15120 [Pseudomonadales bacterium]
MNDNRTLSPSWGNRIIAIIVMMLVTWGTLNFPVASIALLTGFLTYFTLLIRMPQVWILVLPALLPVLYLTPWSGRILWDSFDLLLLTTLAGAIWQGCYRKVQFPQTRSNALFVITLTLFTISWLLSLLIGLFPLDPFDANALSNYHSSYNALRIGKSLLWAVILLPLIHQAWHIDPNKATKFLLAGASTGLLLLGIFVLAERGVFQAISQAQNIYGLVGPIFNFSTTYRVTGLFADMHTGGAAIDAYLLLCLPLALYGAISQQPNSIRIICACASVIGLYSILVTFSRATYAAMALALCIIAASFYLKAKSAQIKHPVLHLIVLPVCIGVILLFMFNRGGSVSLSAGLAITAMSLLAPNLQQYLNKYPALFTLGCAFLFALTLGCYGMATSKWVKNSALEVFMYSVSANILLTLIAYRISTHLAVIANLKQSIKLVLVFTLGCALILPSVFGTRMIERFSVINQDIVTRGSHTLTSLSLMGDRMIDHAFGLGLGSFPRYFSQLPDSHAGSLAYLEEQHSTFLRIGGDDDFKVGQRFTNSSKTSKMHISFTARSDSNASAYVVIARKMINNQLGYNPAWISKAVRIEGTKRWQSMDVELDINHFAKANWLNSQPLALLFINPNRGTLIDIDNVVLKDENNASLIQNGNFEAGGDHWYFYNDIKHLPWHTKNLWVHLYFEMGLLGLITFIAFIGWLLNQLLRQLTQPALAIPITASIAGFLVLGISDGLLDTPRTFFLFLMFALIAAKQLVKQTTANSS